MSIKHLKLDEVRIDGGTQARAEIDTDVVAEYAALLKSGRSMPPVDTFFDGSHYWLAEGFHRWHGHKQAGLLLIASEVRQGTVRDAILFAVGANQGHGLRRNNKDKRNAVLKLLNDPEWVEFSNVKIAELVGVSQNFVREVREQVASDATTLAAQTKDAPRIGKDGKRQSARKKPPKKISGGTTFDVAELEAAVEPKKGKPTFQDTKIEDCFRSLVKLTDERENTVGGNPEQYTALRDATEAAYQAWRVLQRA